MTSGQKTALSLLISVILFAAFALAAFAGLFSAIDARFYEPAKISDIQKKLGGVCAGFDEYLKTLEDRFALGDSAFLKNPSVQSFVESKPGQDDVLSRSELLGDLRASTQGFLGLRVLDKNQNSIHYSTFKSDILRRDEKNNLTAYKNYLDLRSPMGNDEIPVQAICASDSGGDLAAGKKVFFDGEGRAVFSFPLYDKYSVFRGSVLFYMSALDFSNFLLKKNLISVGQSLCFLSNAKPGEQSIAGYALGLPAVGQDEFERSLLDAWQNDFGEVKRLFAIDGKGQNYWVAVTERSESGIFASGVYNDEIFSLSKSARVLILACVFVSLFLICFLALNLRRDDETVIRERIKTLQLGVVDEYLSKKEALDWEAVTGRRDAVTKEIIHSLGRRAKKRPEQVEALINRSWDELFAAMNIKKDGESGGLANAQEIKDMLQEILQSGAIKVQSVTAPISPAAASAKSAPTPAAAPASARPQVSEPAEEVESVEDLEEVEEIEDAEPVEEVESVEDLEEVEEIEEAEPVEDLEEVAPLESVDENENVAPAAPLDSPLEAQPVEDLEEVEEIEDAEPVEDLEEVEEVEEAEPVEDLEEVAPLESVDENENVAPAAPLDSPLEAQPVEDLEEVEEIEEAEPVEEAPPVEDLEEVAELEEVEDEPAPQLEEKKAAPLHSPEEMFDISENVGSDFFAAGSSDKRHEDSSAGSHGDGDKGLDPYKKVRDSFEPDEETESLVQHFEIEEPDYKALDARNDDQTINGTFEDDKKNLVSEVPLEDFGIKPDKEKEEFVEALEFGAPKNHADDDGFDVASTFTTEAPRFERNPFGFSAKAQNAGQHGLSADSAAQSAVSALPLSSGESFMFSTFGQNLKAAADLPAADYSAIEQDSNGVFSIAGDLDTAGFVQDNSFKRLVDSVLNNN